MVNRLSIDLETFSSVDIKKSGVYKYVESPDFEILLVAYSWNGKEPAVVDLTAGPFPTDLLTRLTCPDTLKTAHNAAFEIACLQAHLGVQLDPSQWECTMAKCAQVGLPLSLDQAAKSLGLPVEKMAEGKKLIRYFCGPCAPTKANGQRRRNLPSHAPEKWEQFKAYNATDVAVEMAINKALDFFEFSAREKAIWQLDHKINTRGVRMDAKLIAAALHTDEIFTARLTEEAIRLTGLQNPNSVAQLKSWLIEETGEKVDSLNKETLPALQKAADSPEVKRVLEIRQMLAKTSVKKYTAMQAVMCEDARVRGLHQYYGAMRTGRWAGRLIQPQNLPKNSLKDLDLARELVLERETETLELLFASVPDTISQLIRTSFVAPRGSRLIVSDFSAIEARVLAWLAGEKWRLDVFTTHGKIYEASAAAMFKVPLESIAKGQPNHALRAKGKIAELALGYQGGPGALAKMGALKMGLTEEELQPLVDKWRLANVNIVRLWYRMGEAAVDAMDSPGERVPVAKGVAFQLRDGILWMHLPSGRRLSYQSPRLKEGRYGQVVSYMGMDQTTRQWLRIDSYGGKWVENAIQAISRDVLAEALLRLDAAGYDIVMHVHDEVVCEMPYGRGSAEDMSRIMGQPLDWAPGLPLAAEAYETEYYKKDD